MERKIGDTGSFHTVIVPQMTQNLTFVSFVSFVVKDPTPIPA